MNLCEDDVLTIDVEVGREDGRVIQVDGLTKPFGSLRFRARNISETSADSATLTSYP